MEQSVSKLAKGIYSTLKNSVLETSSWRSAYAQMEADSENEDDDTNYNNRNTTMSNSLFYSIPQQYGEESIPLTESQGYSDRSQLVFSHEGSDDDDTIYLDIPSTQTTSQQPKTLSESLLPTTAASHSLESYAKGTTFNTIKDSAGLLSVMMLIALVVGTIWIYVLRTLTKTIVWGTIIGVPLVFTSIFICLTVMSFIPLILGSIYTYLVFNSRHRIQKTISVIELACDVLRYNPGIILVSFILMCVFIIFTIIWMVLFNRLWLIGYLKKETTSGAIWVVNDNAYLLATFYIFIYLWTSAILINMQRFALSAITADWYFHRHTSNSQANEKTWQLALRRAATISFGTLAFGGLILSIVQFLHIATGTMKKYVKKSRPFVSIITMIISYIEASINQINHYVIGLAGITGDGFCSSARSGTKIFRRNLISGLVGDLITRMVLYVGALVISIASGFGGYIFASHNLHSSHGFIIGLLAAIVPLYMSQFFSYTMMSM
ncbi:plasma-membrane choline transporter-domain-containing protein [Cunninghamella echinulata]|nr:plasma-membrane choline transporter-domain-containing protein [Cunninghamella echinulata]